MSSERRDRACSRAIDSYEEHLRNRSDKEVLGGGNYTSRTYASTSATSQSPWLFDDDDFSTIWTPATATTHSAAQTASSSVPTFHRWALDTLSQEEFDSVLRDPDVVYLFGDSPLNDLRRAVTPSGDKTTWTIDTCCMAAQSLKERLRVACDERLQKEEAEARERKEAQRAEEQQREREQSIMQQAVPRDLSKPMMQLARVGDNARQWQLDALGDSNANSPFYDQEKMRVMMDSCEELLPAKDCSPGTILSTCYRSFIECLRTTDDALAIAGAHNLPWIEDEHAVPPPDSAYAYRRWTYLLGAVMRDQRVELALLEHFSCMASIAWLVHFRLDEDLREQMHSFVARHLCDTVYDALKRRIVDVDTKDIAEARQTIYEACCSDMCWRNLVLSATSTDNDGDPWPYAWALKWSKELRNGKRDIQATSAMRTCMHQFSRRVLSPLAQAIDKAVMWRHVKASMPRSARRVGGQKMRADVPQQLRGSASLRPTDTVYKLVIGDGHTAHRYVATSALATERSDYASERREMLRNIDLEREYAASSPFDRAAHSVRLNSSPDTAVTIARSLLHHSDKHVRDGFRSADVPDESAYFLALVHVAKYQGIPWRVSDAITARSGDTMPCARDILHAEDDYARVDVSESTYTSLSRVFVAHARRQHFNVYIPPLQFANCLIRELNATRETALFEKVKRHEAYERERRRASPIADIVRDASEEPRAKTSQLIAHILLDMALHTDARSSARTLLAIRLIQETKQRRLRTNARISSAFDMDASELICQQDIADLYDDNDMIDRLRELYRNAVLSYKADGAGFSKTFGIDAREDNAVSVEDLDQARLFVRDNNVFDRRVLQRRADRRSLETVIRVALTAINVLHSDLTDVLLSRDYETRVALLCALKDNTSQHRLFLHCFTNMTQRNGNSDMSPVGALRIQLVFADQRLRMKIFAACFAFLCHACYRSSSLSEHFDTIRSEVIGSLPLSSSHEDDEESATQRDDVTIVGAHSGDRPFWPSTAFQPDSENAQLAVFRERKSAYFRQCIAALAAFAYAAEWMGWDPSDNFLSENVLSRVSRAYASGTSFEISVQPPAARRKHVARELLQCHDASRAVLAKCAAVAQYFASLLWSAIQLTERMRDCQLRRALPSHASDAMSVIALAHAMRPSSLRHVERHDMLTLDQAHTVLVRATCDCIDALMDRYGRSDDVEGSIRINAANGVIELDTLVASALYLDHIALQWHNYDTCARFLDLHTYADTHDMFAEHVRTNEFDIGAAKLTKHLKFLRVLNDIDEDVTLKGCAWLVPPDAAVVRFLGDSDDSEYASLRRQLVARCCVPCTIANTPLRNKHNERWTSDRWLERFTMCPFTDFSEFVDDPVPHANVLYRIDQIPPPLPEALQRDVDTYVFNN